MARARFSLGKLNYCLKELQKKVLLNCKAWQIKNKSLYLKNIFLHLKVSSFVLI